MFFPAPESLRQDEEKLCTTCLEWWPADVEFFNYSSKHADGLASQCKACYAQHRPRNRLESAKHQLGSSNTAQLQGLFTHLFQKQEHGANTR